MTIPIVIGFAANPSSPLTYIGLSIAIIGWMFLVRAKWPNLKKLEFMSFGSEGVPAKELKFYKTAYALIACGVFLILFSRLFFHQ